MGDTEHLISEIARSKTLKPGSDHYRAYVGPPGQFDFMGATQFALATSLGLREEHRYLDVGCGSLRAGRFMMQYLLPERYFGIEPNDWLWKESLRSEIGEDIVRIKKPHFDTNSNFDFTVFGADFDMIMAQSIFSHTGRDLLEKGFSSAADVLAKEGLFIFTVLNEATPEYSRLEQGRERTGWIYPQCVTFTSAEVAELGDRFGLVTQELPWFHPRQRWFRAVRKGDAIIDDADTAFRNGRILFDKRFASQR